MAATESLEPEKTELALYIDNEGDLYPQKMAIIKSMKAKIERGKYDPKLAVKGWLYWVNAGAAKYCKEFRIELIRTFPMPVRLAVAKDVAEREFDAIKSGEYGKLEKRTTKTAKKASKKAPRKR
jgi:hypothetical protein